MGDAQIPKQAAAWVVKGTSGFDDLVKEERSIPELGEYDVLVNLKGASLNYRDLIIPQGKYPFPLSFPVVPGSDGAGVVAAVGKKVTRFQPGAKVVTLFNQKHLAGDLDAVSIQSGLGGVVDGTLRTAGVFHEDGLVALPSNLNFIEGATLTCAGLTAWNALYGLNQPIPGQWVLVQGTGGVSLFGLQFAKAAGCRVIATTSSADKEKKLKELGADHVINYKEVPQWGDKAREITGGIGVHHILEVGGPGTMAQSLKAIAISGVISVIGFVGKPTEEQPTFLDALNRICIVRGILVGSRAQFEEMNRAIEANNIHPVVDQKVFKLDETKEAYEYQFAAKHVGKVCIEI